jgi:hypothetical protein
VVAAGHRDRRLVVQADAVQVGGVDRQPDQAHVDVAAAHDVLLLLLGDGDELEGPASALAPGTRPLVGRRAGHEPDAEHIRHGQSPAAQSATVVTVA